MCAFTCLSECEYTPACDAESLKVRACGGSAGCDDLLEDDAYNACLIDGEKTGDLGGDLHTDQFAEAVSRRLRNSH